MSTACVPPKSTQPVKCHYCYYSKRDVYVHVGGLFPLIEYKANFVNFGTYSENSSAFIDLLECDIFCRFSKRVISKFEVL